MGLQNDVSTSKRLLLPAERFMWPDSKPHAPRTNPAVFPFAYPVRDTARHSRAQERVAQSDGYWFVARVMAPQLLIVHT